MAFVTRSERKLNNNIEGITNIGPGEYENEDIKQEARILHKISNIYKHVSKKNNLEINIPFNSTCGRSSLVKRNNNPGPGTYTDNYSNKKKFIKEELPSLNNEIIFIEQNGNLVPKFKNESKGFLSSEKRFNTIFDLKNNENVGPGSYQLGQILNKKIVQNKRYDQNKGNKISKSLDNSIPTIPDKNRGEFKYINGEIKEIKKRELKENELGPGQYNLYPKWDTNTIDWNFGLKKENKNENFKTNLIKSFNKDKYAELKFNNTSLSRLNKSLNKKIKKNISNNDVLEEKQQNNSIKNLVFKRFLKDRKNLHIKSLNKLKEYNDMILDVKYKDTPGPGFYDSKIIKGPLSIFNTNKSQNFGSNTPQFFKINTDNELLGPGSYFIEKNKYEPQFETIIHTKKPEKKYCENYKDIGIYINNFRKNNKDRMPDVGKYNLEKNFIKKEISNVKSFGILSERFKTDKSFDNNEKEIIEEKEKKDEKFENKNDKTNNKYDEMIKIKIDSKYLELKKEEEENEKKKRDKYRDIKKPGVGAYSPEKKTSIYYNVLSKLNPFRNKIAPFNIRNTRFKIEEKINKKNSELPGPGDYEIGDAYNALYNSKKNYNIFGVGTQRNNYKTNSPGPGIYNPNNPNSVWNKKTFNILFMVKTNSL